MRSAVLIATVLVFAGTPVLACEWERSVSNPTPEQVVMSPIPTTADGDGEAVATN